MQNYKYLNVWFIIISIQFLNFNKPLLNTYQNLNTINTGSIRKIIFLPWPCRIFCIIAYNGDHPNVFQATIRNVATTSSSAMTTIVYLKSRSVTVTQNVQTAPMRKLVVYRRTHDMRKGTLMPCCQ